MNLVIDVGNTRVKTAVFKDRNLIETSIFLKSKITSQIRKTIKTHDAIFQGIISSVASIDDVKKNKIKQLITLHEVTHLTKTPFTNNYRTPKTLGVDRVAVITNAFYKFPKKNTLVVDAGTCIKFDFIDEKSRYLGGAISPGIEMRLNALQHFTAKLPKVKKENINYYIGQTTNESILSGVVNGITQEIEGVIQQYKNEYQNLTVVLTGGDTNFLANQLKSRIFANQNFLLEGLNELLIFNTNE